MLTVVCFQWFAEGGRHNHLFTYTTDYVNRLARMLERHLHVPYELVCVTDEPEGLGPDVRVVPTPVEVRDWPGHMRRLVLFRPDAAELFGARILLMDLDVVVLRDMTPVIDRDEDFVSWEPRLYHALGGKYARYNTGFMLMDAGARPHVWSELDIDQAVVTLSGLNSGDVDEQAWISHVLGPNEAIWPWDGDVVSVKAVPRPQDARIVFFNGPRSPGMPAMQREFPWIREHWR